MLENYDLNNYFAKLIKNIIFSNYDSFFLFKLLLFCIFAV